MGDDKGGLREVPVRWREENISRDRGDTEEVTDGGLCRARAKCWLERFPLGPEESNRICWERKGERYNRVVARSMGWRSGRFKGLGSPAGQGADVLRMRHEEQKGE